ncbi:hypothetical protein DOTSEDRAFT_36013 [Dothistroma septosporum NZE10]|uniref:Uncharacterized protein n=1 Tax=Dothistroma septosporum (strain NZE10 / CBS 128990) TaxID=675120 RepID=N1PHI8_DOTSN|nr:hypothetical protein DOTSEDRAFT_36013 [Dothistroma septosporum NZE10]
MPRSHFSALLRPSKVPSLFFICPCAKERYSRLLAESWVVFDSESASSHQKREAKIEIRMLSKGLITEMLNNTFENHMDANWRPCQAEEGGLITQCCVHYAAASTIPPGQGPLHMPPVSGSRQTVAFRAPGKALVETKGIVVQPFEQHPSLLTANTKIRGEASSIFYLENIFVLPLKNFDCTPMLRFKQNTAMRHFYGPGARVNYNMPSPAMNWENLLRWIKLNSQGKMPFMTSPVQADSRDPGFHDGEKAARARHEVATHRGSVGDFQRRAGGGG